MKYTLTLLAAAAVVASFAPVRAHAEDKAPGTTTTAPAAPEKGKAKNKYTALYAQVESITETELVTKGGTDTKFVINAETKISKDKNGKEPAKTSDVKVGQWIGGSYTKGADGTNVLHSLHLGVNQKGPKTK